MLLKFVLLPTLAFGILAKNDFRRSWSQPAPNSHQHCRVTRSRHVRQDTGESSPPAQPQPSNNESPPPTSSRASFKKDVSYKGDDFFSQWNFFTAGDPTHGLVNYQGQDDAQSKRLAYVDDGAVILAIDDTTTLEPGQKRDSVRITSKKTFNGGLFIADFAQMPVGCSLWPAYWSVGPDWSNGGEIDILEGVHNQATNQYTLHTSEGCTASHGSLQVTGQPGKTPQCTSRIGEANTGCAYHDADARSYGEGFNVAGGGVFAHLWDHTGIKVWHFARSDVPQDIQSESPNPDAWGPPAAFWSSETCDIAAHFYDHVLVVDTTLCGDWAGATYADAGCPGTCEEAVANPKNFEDAKWKINYITVYRPV